MKTAFRLYFNMYDNTASEDSEITTDDNQDFGNAELVKDDIEFPDYATLEEDFFLLDGSMPEMPDDPEDVVFFSKEMSDADGNFSTNPLLTVQFNDNHSSVGITVYFVEDYPLEMIVRWYNSNDQVTHARTYDVDSLSYFASEEVNDYHKITFEFTKAKPYRYVKVRYIEYGTQLLFGEDGLPVKNASLVEECDPLSDKIAIDELSFDFIDENDDYNLGNTNGRHNSLQEGQMGEAYEKVDGEDIYLGRFFLSDFSTQSNVVSFSLTDYKGMLDKSNFRRGRVYDGDLAGDVIDDIMADAGIEDYEVSDDVREIPLYGWLKIQTCRKALREVLFACGAVAVSSRSEKLLIYQADRAIKSTIQRSRKFSTKLQKEEYVSNISISYPVYTLAEEESTIVKGDYEAGTYTVDLSAPAEDLVINTGRIIEATDNYVTFEVGTTQTRATSPTAVEVVITGRKYESEEYKVSVATDELSAGETNTTKEYSCTVMNATMVSRIAKSILNYYDMRLTLKTKFLSEGEYPSQWSAIYNANRKYDNFVAGFEKITTDLTAGFVATGELRGYYDVTSDYYYAGEELWAGDDVGVI